MNNKKNIKIIYLFMLVFVTAFFVYGENVASTISSMLESGFDTSKAMKLYGKWADSKSLVIALAKSGDPDKIELAHKIVEHRYNAFEECWRDAVAGAAKKTAKPVEAMVPTGGWKKPLAYKSSDPVNFIIDGANADIDATIFARTEVVEDVTSDILVSWAERTRGDIVSASGEIDYVKVNQVLRDSEVTVFPRHPNGYMSDDFKRKFPEVVHESYPGASGQRSLEVTYMLNKQKAKADIVRYDAKGEMILEDGKAAILRDQPAENVIEDLSQAKYNRLSRISKLDADFELKFKGHIQGLNKSQQDELTAKMLGRMMDEEAAVSGYVVKDNLLYVKAAKVKDAIRQNDDSALKKALKGQDLDDFVRQARQEINRIGIENKRRLVEMMDDSLIRSGKSLDLDALVKSRRGTPKVLKALTLLGYGYDVADAYLRAEKGKETRAVIKGLAVALAADAAGSTVGAAVGASLGQGLLAGAGGVASGIGSGIVAGIVVGAGVDYTAEMIDDLVGGYKADGVVKGMFLNPDNIENFIKMDQQQIKDAVDQRWDQQDQWTGAYYGKMGDEPEQKKRRQEIVLAALETQDVLLQNMIRNKVTAMVFADELKKFYERYQKGEIGPLEIEKEKTRIRDNVKQFVDKGLNSDYSIYRAYFDDAVRKPQKQGVWDRFFSDSDTQENKRIVDGHVQDLKDAYDMLAAGMYDFDYHYSQLKAEYDGDCDRQTIINLCNQLKSDIGEINSQLPVVQRRASWILEGLLNSYARDDDKSEFYRLKALASNFLIKALDDSKRRQDIFSSLSGLSSVVKDGNTDSVENDEEDTVPGWVKKIKKDSKKKHKDKSVPAFVTRSKDSPAKPLGKTNDDMWLTQGSLPKELTKRKRFFVSCRLMSVERGSRSTLDPPGTNKVYPRARDAFSFSGVGRFVGRTFVFEKDVVNKYGRNSVKAYVVLDQRGQTIERFSIADVHSLPEKMTIKDVPESWSIAGLGSESKESMRGSNIALDSNYSARIKGKEAGEHIDSFSSDQRRKGIWSEVVDYSFNEESELIIYFEEE